MVQWYNGPPGVQAARTASHRTIFLQRSESFLAQGRIIDGSKSRDPGNAPDVNVLRAGTVMGKITSGGKYAPSFIGSSSGVLTSTGTTLASSAAVAAELVRRIGTSGTFKLTGPPAAAGVSRSTTVTYSAANLTNGNITITATGANEVQTLGFTNSPAGTFQLGVVNPAGVLIWTAPITYNATIGTLVGNINTALDTALGAGLVVASGTLVTAVALTFSGAGYTALPQTLVQVDVAGLSAGNVSVTRTTSGSSGAFVTGALIQPTDGSEVPLTFIPDWQYGIWVTDEDGLDQTNIDFPQMPVTGVVDSSQLLPWPADASLRTWLKQSLSTAMGSKYVFDDVF